MKEGILDPAPPSEESIGYRIVATAALNRLNIDGTVYDSKPENTATAVPKVTEVVLQSSLIDSLVEQLTVRLIKSGSQQQDLIQISSQIQIPSTGEVTAYQLEIPAEVASLTEAALTKYPPITSILMNTNSPKSVAQTLANSIMTWPKKVVEIESLIS